MNLSMNLKGIVSQRLLQSLSDGLVPALEVMLNEALVRDLIIKGQYEKIVDVMEQNTSIGMQTFDQSLLKLYVEGLIDEETVVKQSDKSSDMKVKLRQAKMIAQDSGLHNMDTSVLSISD